MTRDTSTRAAAARAASSRAAPSDAASPPAPRAGAEPPPDDGLPASPAMREKLARLGIRRLDDLVLHLPLRYEDQTRVRPLGAIRPGESALVEATVAHSEIAYRPRRMLVCHLYDGQSRLALRFFHFYPNQVRALAEGHRVRAYGEVRLGHYGLEMVHPSFRVVAADDPVDDALTPVYPTTAGLSQESLRRLIGRALDAHPEALAETVPPRFTRALGLPGFEQSVRLLHHPPPQGASEALDTRTHPAWQRLKFDELLAQQLSLRRHRRERRTRTAPAIRAPGRLREAVLARAGLALTTAQRRVLREILDDMARPHPMHRLLQGDVGSGKTIVAALAAAAAVEAGFQAAFMAPTEILAEQNLRRLRAWFGGGEVTLTWLSGGQGAAERREALARCASGLPQVIVGTHALFQDPVTLPRLGLAVVDEQHRFGVEQRLALRRRAGEAAEPHLLMMSATPIPRTLAMSYYADLDVSVIDELPPGRTPVATRLASQRRRAEIVERVRKACAQGRQAYWVCPLIEESEKLDLENAIATHAALAAALPELEVGLLHGRMKADEKAAVMAQLAAGRIHVLVATTVVEVGVDVPNASLMVIEHAERFGLAQLHQLRGRVGRGAATSECVLLYDEPLSPGGRARLKVVYEQSDGFEIARQDLLLRGPGEFLGARQSGMPLLRFADLERDAALLEAAREAAARLLRDEPSAADRHLERWLGGREELIRA